MRLPFAAILFLVLLPNAALAQADAGGSDPAAEKLLEEVVAALGGSKWLALRNVMETGKATGFYQGRPTGSIGDFRRVRTMPTAKTPSLQRTEFSKQHDVVTILLPDAEWEITYKGKRLVPPDEYTTTFRRRDHSLDAALRVWWHEPGTVLFYGGQKTVDRHLVEEVTLLNADNDNITLDAEADTHLPFRVSFTWRDPLYKDTNTDATEYADYHPAEGLPTAFNISTDHNGDMTSELYLTRVAYDVPVAPDAFDPDAAAAKLKK